MEKVINTIASIEIVNCTEIIFCRIEQNHVAIKLIDDRILVTTSSLRDLEEKFKGESLYRCHAKSIINLKYIKRYFPKASEVGMKDGSILKIAKDRKSTFNKLLKSILS
jgi:DNA-binding LytR/AlgR family response regulator